MENWTTSLKKNKKLKNIDNLRHIGHEKHLVNTYHRSLGWLADSTNTVRNKFNYTIFQLTLSGEGILIDGDKQYKLSKGMGFITHSLNPNIQYKVSEDSESKEWEFIFIELNGECARLFQEDYYREFGPVFKFDMGSKIFLDIMDDFATIKRRRFMSLLDQADFINLLKKIIIGNIEESVKRKITITDKAIDIIHSNKNQVYNTQQIAKLLNITREHLTRQFKKQFDEGPYHYILKVKTEQAFELLMLSNLTINDISNQLGFSSPTVFGRLFKKIYGITPHRIRKMKEKKK